MNQIVLKTSAPGKVIVFGEHSVVYNKIALAASLGLRTRATLKETTNSIQTFEIHLKKISSKPIVIHLNIIQNLIHNLDKLTFDLTSPDKLDHDSYLEIITKFLNEYKKNEPISDTESQSLIIILYIFIAFVKCLNKIDLSSINLIVDSELEIGSGAGSSASFSVTVASIFLSYIRIKRGFQGSGNVNTFNDLEKSIINKWAFNCEKISHGNPSGVDNTICTYGSLVRFKRNEEPIYCPLKLDMNICLVNTNVKRDTKSMVNKVVQLESKFKHLVENLMEACNCVALEASKIMCEDSNEDYDSLKLLFEINHGILTSLGVSHPSLEKICQISKDEGFGCKLTGAGGGGYAIVLIPPHSSTTDLMNKLEKEGFGSRVTELGGCGVTVD